MIYENNDILRGYLKRGGAEHHQVHVDAGEFPFDDGEFERVLDEVHEQHAQLTPEEAEARAAFRLLTSCSRKAPLAGDFSPGASASEAPRLFYGPAVRAGDFAPGAATSQAPAATSLKPVVVAWGIAVLALLAIIAGLLFGALPANAAPEPDPAKQRVVSTEAVLASLRANPQLLAQLGSAGARVQFLSGSNWSYVASGTPFPVTCVSGCSSTGAFGDNSAFTVGTTAITPIGAYYTTGGAPSIGSGNAGRVRMDSNSYLYVDCITGCSASAGFGDNSAFTAGSTAIGITGGWYSTSATNCTSGNACAPQLTQDRKLFVQAFQGASPWVVSANGGSFAVTQSGSWTTAATQGGSWNVGQSGTWTVQQGGAPWPVSQSGAWTVQPGNTANTTPWLMTISQGGNSATVTGANALKVDGSAVTQPVSGSVNATLQAGAGTDIGKLDANQSVNVAQVNGSTAATAATGVQKVGVVGNAGAAVDAAFGSAPPANGIAIAGLGSGATGGELIGLPVGDAYVPINISTATTTLVISGVASRKVRFTAIHLIVAGADNVAFIEGTGSTCGTGTAGMAGGTTAASGFSFAANGGIALGSGVGTVMQTATTGDSVCIVTSAAVQLSGGIQYTVY